MAYLDPKSHFTIKDRLRGWLGSQPADGAPAPASRPNWQQQVYADVGDFLSNHRLDPTPNNYDLAYQYRAAHNASLVTAIRTEIERSGTIDADAAERIFAESGGPVSVEALSDFTERIEAQAAGLTVIARQSAGDAKDFSSALEQQCDTGQDNLAAIVELTQSMVARTRLAESQLRHAQKQLNGLRTNLVAAQQAADVDPLTELPNRRAFKRDLAAMVASARNRKSPLSLAFCDIDHFKHFNDRYGHETGDRVLRYVATALAQAFAGRGVVARFGGEEFLVALPDLSLTGASKAIDSAREALAARHLYSATDNSDLGLITFSAGVTTMSTGDEPADLLRRADEALYRAKAAGRNCVVIG
jgi:diguanylate cyclase